MVEKIFWFRPIHQTMQWLIVVLVGVLIMPESAVAQQDTDQSAWEMEEVFVVGERPTLFSLEMQVNHAEELKFKLFNDLNSTDEFDIICEYRTPTGSRIRKWVCDVGYIMEARAEDASDYLIYGDPPRSDFDLASEFAHKAEALNKEMAELAIKHPSLAKAMINEYELKQRYTVEWRERFKDSILAGHLKPEKYFGDELKFLQVAFIAHNNGMMEEERWSYWNRRFRSVIRQEPYRSLWLSSNSKTYANEFIAYVNTILSE